MRFTPGTRLRVELILTPAMRDAIAAAKPRAADAFAAVDGATMIVDGVSHTECVCRMVSDAGTVEVRGDAAGELPTRLDARFTTRHGAGALQLSDIRLQSGGRSDTYIARFFDGALRQLVRFRYEPVGGATIVSLFTAAFSERLPRSVASILPAQVELVRLTPTVAGA